MIDGYHMDIKKLSDKVPILIDLREFDENPGPNCMSFGFDIKPLINSIENIGLINTPFVTRNMEGRLDIVAGYRRILALKALKYDRAHCIDLSNSGLSSLEMLLFNLYDNIAIRRFNEVEKGMILNRLMAHMSRKDIEEHYIQILGIKNRRDIDTLIRIDELNETTKQSIAHGTISTKTIGLILDLDNRSRSVILKWISDLNLNVNQQLKYIDYLIDISSREGKPIADIMDEDRFLTLLKDKELNTPQKAKKMLVFLRARRLPLLTDSEKKFDKMIQNLKLPDGVRITHSPFFERKNYFLEIVFDNGRDLKKTIDNLARIEDLKRIGDPWRKGS